MIFLFLLLLLLLPLGFKMRICTYIFETCLYEGQDLIEDGLLKILIHLIHILVHTCAHFTMYSCSILFL